MVHVCDPAMSCKSEESTSSADNLDFKNDVTSVLVTIKAAMKTTLAMVVMSNIESQCHETTLSPKAFKLKRGIKINAEVTWERRTRLTYSDDWKRVAAIAKESLAKLQDAYSIILNNKNKFLSLEGHYGMEETQKMFQKEYLKSVKVKNIARSKASRKKSASLNMWHSCIKDARKNLNLVGKSVLKKDTAYYNECKRLMQEKK